MSDRQMREIGASLSAEGWPVGAGNYDAQRQLDYRLSGASVTRVADGPTATSASNENSNCTGAR
jgi:hypothetical protein